MRTNYELVRFWSDMFGVANNYLPRHPDLETVQLRQRLMAEEHAELQQAIADRAPIKEIAKEIGDLLWTAYGTAAAYGIDIDAVMVKIYESNMSKTPDVRGGKAIKGPNYREADLSFLD
jgi:predicted HAD superfamily Cof-like phosphohydrolase